MNDPILKPNIDDMVRHLEHLFGELPACAEGLIELGYTQAAAPHPLNRAKHFDIGDLLELAAEAAELNAVPGVNVYVGPGIRKAATRRNTRTGAADIAAVPAVWADLDDEGSVDRAREFLVGVGLQPSLAVQTGEYPYQRAQIWWRLDEPQTDLQEARHLLAGIAARLGGDKLVINPDRLMRLAGSVAWPMKPGRKTELTKLIEW
jgi:hypothetical protein